MNDFTINQQGWHDIEQIASKHVGDVTNAVHNDVLTSVPRDTNELADSVDKKHNPGDLVGTVSVGTDHWAPTEYGSRPHKITIKTKKVLANKESGQFFGKEVDHPGTPSQPFMIKSLYTKRKLRKGI